jgi:hypothetical protein
VTHEAPTHHEIGADDAEWVALGALAALVVRKAALKRAEGIGRRPQGEEAGGRRPATAEGVGLAHGNHE